MSKGRNIFTSLSGPIYSPTTTPQHATVLTVVPVSPKTPDTSIAQLLHVGPSPTHRRVVQVDPAAPKTKPAPPVVEDDGQPERIKSPEQFWSYMNGFNWHDRSEAGGDQMRAATGRLQHLSIADRLAFRAHFDNFVKELQRIIGEAGCLRLGNHCRDLLSHVVARGLDFYNGVLAEPSFVDYLTIPVGTAHEYVPFYPCFDSSTV